MTLYFFFFNDTATTEIYTLSLHDALPISTRKRSSGYALFGSMLGSPSSASRIFRLSFFSVDFDGGATTRGGGRSRVRSEEHTSELQSRQYLVCRLLLEKKKKIHTHRLIPI